MIKFLVISLVTFTIGFFSGKYFESSKMKHTDTVATYEGEDIKMGELNTVDDQLKSYEQEIKRIKSQAIKEKVIQKSLQKEADKSKVPPDQLLAKIRTEHEKDQIDEKAFHQYISTQGKDVNKLTKVEIERFKSTFKSIQLMNAQNEYMQSLIDDKKIKMKE